MASTPVISAHWYHLFDNLQLSSNEFYASIEQSIKENDLPKVSTTRINLSEGGLLSSNREYLRIKRNDYIFDICAAPFGKQFFISWWLGESSGILGEILSKIPFIGGLLARKAKQKTYYQIDTETMFKESIHGLILVHLDALVKQKGVRSLNETERRILTDTHIA